MGCLQFVRGDEDGHPCGIRSLAFSVALPDLEDTILTADEAALLTNYTFAGIDRRDPNMACRTQVNTRSPILLALTDCLVELMCEKPQYGQPTWEEAPRAY